MRELEMMVLDNGLKVVLYPDDSCKTIFVGLICFSGSRNDPEGREGLRHVAEHLPFRGTVRYPDGMSLISDTERYDAEVNAYTGKDRIVFKCQGLPPLYLELGLKVVSELVLFPLLRKIDWEEERHIIHQEYKGKLSDPEILAACYLLEKYFDGTRLAHSPLGFAHTIDAIAIEDIQKAYQEDYTIQNMCLVLTGNLSPYSHALANKYFGKESLQSLGSNHKTIASLPSPKKKEYELVGGIFSHPLVLLAHFFPELTQRQDLALGFFTSMLGGGTSSNPLYQQLRERRKLVYSSAVRSSKSVPGISCCVFSTQTNPELVQEVIRGFWEIVAQTLEDQQRFAWAQDQALAAAETYDPGAVKRFAEIENLLRFEHAWITDEAWCDYVASITYDKVMQVASQCFREKHWCSLIAHS